MAGAPWTPAPGQEERGDTGRSGVPVVLDEVAAEGDVGVILVTEDCILTLTLVEPHPDLILLLQV